MAIRLGFQHLKHGIVGWKKGILVGRVMQKRIFEEIAFLLRFLLMLQLIKRFILISTFLFSLGGSHSLFRARPVPAVNGYYC